MKLTKGLLERLIKEEIKEAKYGGNPYYSRDRIGMRDMTYGEKRYSPPKNIDSFKTYEKKAMYLKMQNFNT